ncbi:matrixin family metalloprotease [Candidatus Bathyarchaeota archaeon]|nr:matrixin family metalloprotease [Candidatus Bathyarchaeota archaeon]
MFKLKFVLIFLCTFLMFNNILICEGYAISGYEWDSSKVDPLKYYNANSYFLIDSAAYDWNYCLWGYPSLSSVSITNEDVWVEPDDFGETGWSGIFIAWETEGYNYLYCYIFINTYEIMYYSNDEIKSVIAHEFGHCWGLAHVYTNNLMNPSDFDRFSNYVYSPKDDDVDGVGSIY